MVSLVKKKTLSQKRTFNSFSKEGAHLLPKRHQKKKSSWKGGRKGETGALQRKTLTREKSLLPSFFLGRRARKKGGGRERKTRPVSWGGKRVVLHRKHLTAGPGKDRPFSKKT